MSSRGGKKTDNNRSPIELMLGCAMLPNAENLYFAYAEALRRRVVAFFWRRPVFAIGAPGVPTAPNPMAQP